MVIAGRPKTVGAIANPSATHAAQLPFTHELLLVRMRTFCHVTASLTRSTELKTATVFRPALTTAVTVLCAGLSACAYLPPDDCSPHHEYCGHPHTGNPSYPSKNPPPRAHRPPPDMHQDMRPHHRPQQPDARPAPHTPPRQDYRDDRRPPPRHRVGPVIRRPVTMRARNQNRPPERDRLPHHRRPNNRRSIKTRSCRASKSTHSRMPFAACPTTRPVRSNGGRRTFPRIPR